MDKVQASNTADNEYNTNTLKLTQTLESNDGYGRLKEHAKPFMDTTYSHTKESNGDFIRRTQDNTYSHIGNNIAQDKHKEEASDTDNTYNRAQTHPKLKSDHTAANHAYLTEDQYSEYDHAVAGGHNPNVIEADEYSHLNGAVMQTSHIARRGYINRTNNGRANVDELEGTTVEYEQESGLSPDYSELEPAYEESVNTDRHYFVLEKENNMPDNN